MRATTLTALFLAGALGCGKATPGAADDAQAKPVSALVVVYDQGKVSKAHRLTEAKQVAALAAHFPGYEKRPASDVAGTWKRGYDVYFDFPAGASVRLTVSSSRNTPTPWSAGRGDFEAEGDFHKFVAGLGE